MKIKMGNFLQSIGTSFVSMVTPVSLASRYGLDRYLHMVDNRKSTCRVRRQAKVPTLVAARRIKGRRSPSR